MEDLLLIPGPVQLSPAVLEALARQPLAHTSPEFIGSFGSSLDMLGKIFLSKTAQPMIVSGSGTLAMECAISNLIEPGDKALVVSSGYFGDRFQPLIERHGGEVTLLSVEAGEAPSAEAAETMLEHGGYRLMTVTHVDTSTGVATDIKRFAEIARRHNVLLVVDSVCGIGGMEFRMDEWDVDLCLTGSQKALAAPAGLAILMIGQRALERFHARKEPSRSYYADWAQWLPIMKAYSECRPAYFATPAVNLFSALEATLREILAEGIENRWARHKQMSSFFKDELEQLGFEAVPSGRAVAATTMSAYYYGKLADSTLCSKVKNRGVTLAGGIHKDIKDRYFRVGHMGNVTESQLEQALKAIKSCL
jgi:alanine-glyoxylate transaminase / serine-glyoxylate transaminase / serine-pyruvate transaminase